jgi:hypothetical protein
LEERLAIFDDMHQHRRSVMNMSKYTGSNYITAEFLKALGRDVRIETKITSVEDREFEGKDKAVVHLDYQAKAIVLNPTRTQVLVAAFGIESEGWIGKTIIIYPDVTTFQGKKVDCVALEAVGGQRIGAVKRPALNHDRNGAPSHEAYEGPDDGQDEVIY